MPEIDTMNKSLVASGADGLVIMRPMRSLTYDDALNLAAYLVAMADGMGTHSFADVLKAVQNT